jgi:Npun R1517
MKPDSLEQQSLSSEFAVYDCEIRLKFRLIEDKQILGNREQLLEILLDAFSYGADEYLEPVQAHVEAHELPEMNASPEMRRQLIRLRNSSGDIS